MSYKEKVIPYSQILPTFRSLRERESKIVFTNGCFDLLHPGHIEYLEQAKELGDILAVGLNSDKSVSRLKGAKRPINCEVDRAHMLAALSCVNYVIIFEQDTPYELINAIKPHVLVKGGDWKAEEIVGNDVVQKCGGKVMSLHFKESYSSTALIEKIARLYGTNG